MNHPVRQPEVQKDIEEWTEEMLRLHAGTGRIIVEFDFVAWKPVSYRPVVEGRKRRLTAR